jgi:hypothetical protein
MRIYTIGHIFLAAFIAGIVTSIIITLKDNSEEQAREIKRFEQLPLSKCDSLVLSNDSLVIELVALQNRVLQYQTGLSFLKDKNKKAYDYAINAGNLKFKDEW